MHRGRWLPGLRRNGSPRRCWAPARSGTCMCRIRAGAFTRTAGGGQYGVRGEVG
jgi:hypothetical protein